MLQTVAKLFPTQSILKSITVAILFALPTQLFAEDSPAKPEPKLASADIVNNQGKVIGKISLTQGTTGVLIQITASELPAGFHGMHFHSVADCSDHQHFKNALGHVDPHKKPHGYLNPQGPHEGNLPNLVVAGDGKVEVELFSEMVSLETGDANLLDADGSALIVHINRDDHFSQPIGGSGERIACAEIKGTK